MARQTDDPAETGPISKHTLRMATGETIFVQVHNLGDSAFVWVQEADEAGGCAAVLRSLAMAMPTRMSPEPAVTQLLSAGVDDSSARMAGKLAARFGRPIQLSCNISGSRHELVAHVERELAQRIIPDLWGLNESANH